MANLSSATSFNYYNANLYRLTSGYIEAKFSNYDPATWADGTKTTQKYEIHWNNNGQVYSSVFAGNNITFDSYGNVTGGTVNSYVESYWTGTTWSPMWAVTNINISAAKIVSAAKTSNTTDDYSIFNTMLAGDDSIYGSNSADVLYGGDGNDTIYGRGGNDIISGGAGTLDVAIYTGRFSDYRFGYNEQNNTISIADTILNRDGTDIVDGIELFQFSDTTKTLKDIQNIFVQPAACLAYDSGGNNVTNTGKVLVSGVRSGSTWQYSINNGQNWINGSGSSFTISGDGTKSVIVRQTDAFGNISLNSNPLVFSLDTRAPTSPSLSLANDSGFSSTDKITNYGVVKVAGLEAGATWQYSTNNGQNWLSGSGTSLTLTGDGAKNVIARQIDAAGNISVSSTTLAFMLDTIAPTRVILNAPINTGGKWTISGKASVPSNSENKNSISIYDGSNLIGSATANQSGDWSFTASQSNNVIHAFSATATDLAGNTGDQSRKFYTGTNLGDSFNLVQSALGGDRVAGGAGNDIYNMTSSLSSKASRYWEITDFSLNGTDYFKIGHNLLNSDFRNISSTNVAGLNGDLQHDLGNILNNSNFAANGADLVNIAMGNDAGTYAVINDNIAGYNPLTDGVVKLQAGVILTASNFIA